MRRFRTILLLFILFITAWYFHTAWLGWLGHALIQEDPLFKADVIAVLAGDTVGERITRAVELAQQQWAPRILVSSAGPNFDTSEGELAIQYAVRRGSSRDLFELITHEADSTKEEAVILAAECRRRGVKKLLLVTSDYHTRRAGNIFRSVAPDIEVRTVGSKTKSFNPDTWWTVRPSRKVWLMEAMKTVANWLRM